MLAAWNKYFLIIHLIHEDNHPGLGALQINNNISF